LSCVHLSVGIHAVSDGIDVPVLWSPPTMLHAGCCPLGGKAISIPVTLLL